MNAQALHAHGLAATTLPARACIALLFLLIATDLMAQITVVQSRNLSVNGRPIQEIRQAREPGSRILMRAVVVTNGPTAGTTSLLTAVADANAWPDPNAAAPVFTPVIASGTVFSIGGGCPRGNQLDFPFIDGNRPRILRIVNGTPTVITPAIPGSDFFDSADCTVSGDGTRTFFIFTNRSFQRLCFFVDAGGANDLTGPQVSFSATRTPFEGGLRPSISMVPGTAQKVALLFMQTNGQSRWLQYDAGVINVDFNCLAGVQSPAPTGFTIPRGAKVANREAVGDFNNDGRFEIVRIVPTPPATCAAVPTNRVTNATDIGPVAGTAYNWSEPGIVFDPFTGRLSFVAGSWASVLPDGSTYITPGPQPAVGGSYSGCAVDGTESYGEVLTMNAAQQQQFLDISQKRYRDSLQRTEGIHRSGVEELTAIDLFCLYFRGDISSGP